MIANTLTWVALLTLTLTGYAVSDQLGGAAALPILAFAATKSSLVGFRFMGLGRAHLAVRVAFVVSIGGLVAALALAGGHLRR